jgi:DNA-binding GntR family transcriptional regulator
LTIAKELRIIIAVDRRQKTEYRIQRAELGGIKLSKYTIEKPVSYYDQIYSSIKQMIFNGSLQPGDYINESKLATQFQISRSPIREAIRSLEKEGLLVIDEKSKLRVYQPKVKDVVEIYECRQALEALSTKLATQRMNEEELRILEAKLIECKSNIEIESEHRTDTIILLNTQFHELIFEFSRNDYLQRQINGLRSLTNYYRGLNVYNKNRFEEIYNQHFEIFRYIKERNEELASKKMVDHIFTDMACLKSTLAIQNTNRE